ncbi:MAG: fasciclin domain-containing protein [Butyricimonas faecihominis]
MSNGRFDGSLLEYMDAPGHSYDWDSTVLMVRHAGEAMVRLFEGNDPDYPEITFFGPTNHSIRRYMLENDIERVEDMDPAWCAEVLKRHIVKGKIYRADVPAGKPATSGAATGEGGKGLHGDCRAIVFTSTRSRNKFNGVEGFGETTVYISSLDSDFGVRNFENLASIDIEPDNCVVHSLRYDFTLGDM